MTECHDFLVQTNDPIRLDSTLDQLPDMNAHVRRDNFGKPMLVESKHIVRVFGDTAWFKFACEQQGYCKIIREVK